MQTSPPPKRFLEGGIDRSDFYGSVGAVAGAASAINFTGPTIILPTACADTPLDFYLPAELVLLQAHDDLGFFHPE